MHNLKIQILTWGMTAVFATVGMLAQAQQPATGAAFGGAVVSNGQNDLMNNAEKQTRTLERMEQRTEKADEALGTSKMWTPKPAVALPDEAAKGDKWCFSEVKAVRYDAEGHQALDTGPGTAEAKLLLMKVTADSKEKLLDKAQNVMREHGYYLYHVIDTAEAGKNLVALTADLGHIESLNVTFVTTNVMTKVETNAAVVTTNMIVVTNYASSGRWFSDEQIRKHYMWGVGANEVFNYNTLYDRFYELNSQPDLSGRLTLHPVTNSTGEVIRPDIRRLALRLRVTEVEKDIPLIPRYTMPLHFVFGVDNSGTDAADNWMGRATVQYLNLTRHDDVVTFNYQNSLADFDALGGFAASYYLPHYLPSWLGGGDAAFTLYGGGTDVDSKDVVPGIDVQGEGWFIGIQESFTCYEDRWRSLKLALGGVWRNVDDNLVVQGEKLEGNEVTVAPLSLALMYGEKAQDVLHGMNFLTLEALHEFGGFLGASDEDEIKAQRAAASEDYTVLHLQVARLQMLPFLSLGGTNTFGNPMLFARVNGQWADGALIPAEQFGLGGDGSVRGYATREYLGDLGLSGTVEARLPIILGLLDRKAGVTDAPWDRLQAVAFFDWGVAKVEDPLPGEDEEQWLYGAGLGVRLALTDHFQIKCDVAFPLKETPDSDDVCVHFSGQVQF